MISVIVPVYNVKNYICRCVDSILCQTMQDFELILVDDGSADGSGEICDTLGRKDARIHVIHQSNQGLSAARNRGLKEARGEYITYIDSDDYIEPPYLETLYRNARTYQAEIAVCSYRLVWEQKDKSRRHEQHVAAQPVVYSGREAATEIVGNSQRRMITAWGKLYHNRLRQWLHYPEGRLHEDEFVTYRVLYKAERVVVSNEPYYQYVQRGGSIMSGSFREQRLDKLSALKKAITFFVQENDMDLAGAARKRYLLNIQIAWYRVRKFLPEKKTLMLQLRDEWKEIYDAYKKEILERSSWLENISIRIYRISPLFYCVIADICQRVFPEV